MIVPVTVIVPLEVKEVAAPIAVTFNVPAIEEEAEVEVIVKVRPPPWFEPFRVKVPPAAIDNPTPAVLIVIVRDAPSGCSKTAEALLIEILFTVVGASMLTVREVLNTTSLDALGTPDGDQFPAVLHVPLLAPTQVLVCANNEKGSSKNKMVIMRIILSFNLIFEAGKIDVLLGKKVFIKRIKLEVRNSFFRENCGI